jgi:hypothetical protein
MTRDPTIKAISRETWDKTIPQCLPRADSFRNSLPVTDSYGHSRKIAGILSQDRILAAFCQLSGSELVEDGVYFESFDERSKGLDYRNDHMYLMRDRRPLQRLSPFRLDWMWENMWSVPLPRKTIPTLINTYFFRCHSTSSPI